MPTVHLTDLTVKALKPSKTNVTYWSDVTPGFGIRVGKRSRTWTVMRGRSRERVTIGRYPDVTLSDARREALRLLSEERTGPKPINKTFKEARTEFLAEHYRGVTSRWPRLVRLMVGSIQRNENHWAGHDGQENKTRTSFQVLIVGSRTSM